MDLPLFSDAPITLDYILIAGNLRFLSLFLVFMYFDKIKLTLLKYTISVVFYIFIKLCNHHYYLISNYFINSIKKLCVH